MQNPTMYRLTRLHFETQKKLQKNSFSTKIVGVDTKNIGFLANFWVMVENYEFGTESFL